MVSLITPEEIEEIFTNFEKLKKKAQGNDNSVEARVSANSMCLTTYLVIRECPSHKSKAILTLRCSSRTRSPTLTITKTTIANPTIS